MLYIVILDIDTSRYIYATKSLVVAEAWAVQTAQMVLEVEFDSYSALKSYTGLDRVTDVDVSIYGGIIGRQFIGV